MELLLLEKRLTRRWNDDWAHRDAWEAAGVAMVTPPRMVAEGNGLDDGPTYIRWATLKKLHPSWGLDDRDKAARALEDTLSRVGCSCEYDCCGCASVYARVLHRRGRRIALRIRVTYNY